MLRIERIEELLFILNTFSIQDITLYITHTRPIISYILQHTINFLFKWYRFGIWNINI